MPELSDIPCRVVVVGAAGNEQFSGLQQKNSELPQFGESLLQGLEMRP